MKFVCLIVIPYIIESLATLTECHDSYYVAMSTHYRYITIHAD